LARISLREIAEPEELSKTVTAGGQNLPLFWREA
jgi:hypothetical protein